MIVKSNGNGSEGSFVNGYNVVDNLKFIPSGKELVLYKARSKGTNTGKVNFLGGLSSEEDEDNEEVFVCSSDTSDDELVKAKVFLNQWEMDRKYHSEKVKKQLLLRLHNKSRGESATNVHDGESEYDNSDDDVEIPGEESDRDEQILRRQNRPPIVNSGTDFTKLK